MTTARCRTLSSNVGIPSGRVSFPVPFGMRTRRTGGARYAPDLARSSSDSRFSMRVSPSGPARTLGKLGSLAPWLVDSYTVLRDLVSAHGGQTMAGIHQVGLDEVVGYFDELEDPRSTINQKHPLDTSYAPMVTGRSLAPNV